EYSPRRKPWVGGRTKKRAPEGRKKLHCRGPVHSLLETIPMPELPEVETIARGLAKRVTGDRIESVWLGQKKEPLKSPATEIAAALEQSRIASVHRMGKHIVFDLDRAA